MNNNQILLTNDDGIDSPGLWAAAEALSQIGFVHVVAPNQQYSGAGRSLPRTTDGTIQKLHVQVGRKTWEVYAVGGTPSQAVLHAVLEVLPERPALVVSGINYGENIGSGITISGTVGAALEAAALGIPALAISWETDVELHLTNSENIDFSTAAYFAAYFGRIMLEKGMPPDVDILNVNLPNDASHDTPWEITRLSRKRYFEPVRAVRSNWSTPGPLTYRLGDQLSDDPPDTDVYTLHVKRAISVTPISLDMTSRIDLGHFHNFLSGDLVD